MVSERNQIRRAMQSGFPVRCTHVLDGPGKRKRCGEVIGFLPLVEIFSVGGVLLGWRCQRGHVLGKCEAWLNDWPSIEVGQVLEAVALTVEGRADQIQVVDRKRMKDGSVRWQVRPLNFNSGHGFRAGNPGWKRDDLLRKEWRLIGQS